MSGPEHYREAERLSDYAEEHAFENGPEWYANAMAAAQVHATLALAAATLAAAEHDGQARYDAASACRPGLLVLRPHPGNEVDPPYPGNDWGRALYGEVTR